MRTARLVALVLLLALVLTACGAERDIGVQIHVEGQDTSVAAAPGQAASTAPALLSATLAPTTVLTGTALPAQPEAAATQPAEPPQPEPPAGAAYTFDPLLWDQGLATLGSFRQKLVLDFTADEVAGHSKVTYEGDVTVQPSALHSMVRVEGQAAGQLPSNQVEVIWIGEEVWVKVGRRPWVQVPASAVQSEYAGEVVAVGQLLPFIAQADRVLPDETVNGIPCQHYTYDVDNLQSEVGMTSAQGDIWVAKDGGYVVRLTLEGQGTYYDTYSASGTLHLVYDLYDVNVPLTIEPPR